MSGIKKMKKGEGLFKTFVGEYVQIIQDFEVVTSFNIEEDNTQEVRTPMTVTGFLMDLSDGFLYLSPDGENIDQALPLHTVKNICILEVQDEADTVLDTVLPPDKDSGYN